jgi:hypothetical protein
MASTSEAIERAIHFVLKGSADRLRGEGLARIIELAHKAEAVVHVSFDSWQVLIGVPERNSPNLEAELSSMGYVCTIPYGSRNDTATFVLDGRHNETGG